MEIWNELTIKVATGDTERAAAICTAAAHDGLYIEDYSELEREVDEIAHIDLIDEELLARDRAHSLIHIYIKDDASLKEARAYISDMLTAEGIEHEASAAGVKEEDWASGWKRHYHVQHIGRRLVVRPSWEEYSPAPGEVVMSLDPGMAFGTGTHDTTRLCLELLEETVTPSSRVLDVGCGSGILSISAALLGAPEALGVDIDPVAVRTARDNAELNGVSAGARFICGDLTEKADGLYEIVTANIVADVIIRLLSTVRDFMVPGGVLITSGIIDTRAEEVLSACLDAGFSLVKRLEHGGWVAFELQKI